MSQAAMTLSERADELEEQMMHELNEKIATKSVLFGMADGKVEIQNGNDLLAKNPGKYFLMGADNRLPAMPDKPTLIDFFKLRFASTAHLLQSAKHALRNGLPEKNVLACLLHDIGVVSFIRCDHGYWGAQMIEPYVDEEVSWAIRMHQCLRFFPEESVNYKYPDQYIKLFGPDYVPEPYIQEEYKRARNHKWYMTSRATVCLPRPFSDSTSFAVRAVTKARPSAPRVHQGIGARVRRPGCVSSNSGALHCPAFDRV